MTDTLLPLKSLLREAIAALYQEGIADEELVLSPTKKEFVGDYTLVCFGLSKKLRQKPQEIAANIGQWLMTSQDPIIAGYNVIQGFLNLSLSATYWHHVLKSLEDNRWYEWPRNGSKVLVEFSSPNTNKPLHLGHIRNILLGWSTFKVLDKIGYDVIRTQIINDRGIAICKSMIAWKLFGDGATPYSTSVKGDHLVGEYYRKFELAFSDEYKTWQTTANAKSLFENRTKADQTEDLFFKNFKNTYFNEYSNIGRQAKEMLLKWEEGDLETRHLWKQMNAWVYEGFNITYDSLGVAFDTLYYESDTYLLGKDMINRGLTQEVFYREIDGSVWVNLEDVGLDRKILLRNDGTSVYMTQDLGTADQRHQDTGAEKMIYVVADEQDYHFKALFEILKKLKVPYAEGLYHLSYGMVDLPSGRMKSREGTVVDADDLLAEVLQEVCSNSVDRTELNDLNTEDRLEIYKKIALSAIKFFILKVNPRKRMIFDPTESVDIQGQTGPYIQNAYVRIHSIYRKINQSADEDYTQYDTLAVAERDVLRSATEFRLKIEEAAANYDPSSIATFAYELAKHFHKMYHDVRIINAESEAARIFRMKLAAVVARQLKESMDLIGVEMPERM